jgi:hypothetical protein
MQHVHEKHSIKGQLIFLVSEFIISLVNTLATMPVLVIELPDV